MFRIGSCWQSSWRTVKDIKAWDLLSFNTFVDWPIMLVSKRSHLLLTYSSDVRCFVQVSTMAAADWLQRFGFKPVFMPDKISDSTSKMKQKIAIHPMIRLPKSTKNVHETQLGTVLKESATGKFNSNFELSPELTRAASAKVAHQQQRQQQLNTLRQQTQPQQPSSSLKRAGSKSRPKNDSGESDKKRLESSVTRGLEKAQSQSMGTIRIANETLSLDAIRAQLHGIPGTEK